MAKGRTSQDSPNVSKTRPSPQIGVQTVLSTVSTFSSSLVQPKQAHLRIFVRFLLTRVSMPVLCCERRPCCHLQSSSFVAQLCCQDSTVSIVNLSVVLHTVFEAKDDVPILSKSLRWILNQSFSIHIFLVFLERFNWSLSMPAATAICLVPLTSSRGPPASKRSRFPKLAFQSSRSQPKGKASQEAKNWKESKHDHFFLVACVMLRYYACHRNCYETNSNTRV